jgi:hypothetical protein
MSDTDLTTLLLSGFGFKKRKMVIKITTAIMRKGNESKVG